MAGIPKQITLHGGTHGARVDGVVAHVGAVVDAGDDQIGAVTQQTRQRNVHAVRRRAVDIAKAVGRAVHVERRMQGQRIGLGAVVVLGSDHLNLGNVLERFMERHDARCLVAVVVGDQDFHGGRASRPL
jgi:hypothetical protein